MYHLLKVKVNQHSRSVPDKNIISFMLTSASATLPVDQSLRERKRKKVLSEKWAHFFPYSKFPPRPRDRARCYLGLL